jgi:hypothetical protein
MRWLRALRDVAEPCPPSVIGFITAEFLVVVHHPVLVHLL